MKIKRITILTMATAFLTACFSSSILDQAKRLGTKEFDRDTWSTAQQEERGLMVYSFLSRHAPTSLTAQQVKELLGQPTGYYDHDENAAYLVGPKSVESRYGNGYLLVFLADKSSGKIASVRLIPEPK